jgi:hypothetical protein
MGIVTSRVQQGILPELRFQAHWNDFLNSKLSVILGTPAEGLFSSWLVDFEALSSHRAKRNGESEGRGLDPKKVLQRVVATLESGAVVLQSGTREGLSLVLIKIYSCGKSNLNIVNLLSSLLGTTHNPSFRALAVSYA